MTYDIPNNYNDIVIMLGILIRGLLAYTYGWYAYSNNSKTCVQLVYILFSHNIILSQQ